MNFDDTARFNGPSEKLWPELFEEGMGRASLMCPLCEKAVLKWNSRAKQYDCVRCGSFYKPLHPPPYVPARFRRSIPTATAATTLCRDCRRVVVEGRRRYCEKCLAARHRKSKRESARKRRSNVDKSKNSLIRAEALTSVEKDNRCGQPATEACASSLSTQSARPVRQKKRSRLNFGERNGA
jgi:hypothetical protein